MQLTRLTCASTAVVAVLVGSLTACASSTSSNSPEGIGQGDGKGDIKLGVVISKTGSASSLGLNEVQGVELAVGKLNAAGGINGRKITLTVRDDQSDPTSAVTATRQLISDGIQAIIGPAIGGPCTAITPILDSAKVPGYCLSGFPQPADDKFQFYGLPQQVSFTEATLQWLKDKGLTRVGIVNTTDASGVKSVEAYMPYWSKYGITVVDHQQYPVDSQDATVQLTKLRQQKPQILFAISSGAAPTATALRGLRDLNWNIPVMLAYSNATQTFLDAVKSVLPPEAYLPGTKIYLAESLPDSDPQKALYTAFSREFSTKYKTPADMFSAEAYDAVNILARAIASTDGSGQAVRDWMINQMGTYQGVTGPIDFTETDLRGVANSAVVLLKATASGFGPAS
jgi:branched-chain amino acid transport system substrate-binding protein